jgi:hypothetical protein
MSLRVNVGIQTIVYIFYGVLFHWIELCHAFVGAYDQNLKVGRSLCLLPQGQLQGGVRDPGECPILRIGVHVMKLFFTVTPDWAQ